MNLWTDICKVIVAVLVATDICRAAAPFANFSNEQMPEGIIPNQFVAGPIIGGTNSAPGSTSMPMIGIASTLGPAPMMSAAVTPIFGQIDQSYAPASYNQWSDQQGQAQFSALGQMQGPQGQVPPGAFGISQAPLSSMPSQAQSPQGQFGYPQGPIPNMMQGMEEVGPPNGAPQQFSETGQLPEASQQMLVGDQGAPAEGQSQEPEETQIRTSSGFCVHISTFMQQSLTTMFQENDWNKDGGYFGLNASLQLQFEKINPMAKPILGIAQYSVSFPMSFKIDPSAAMTLSPLVDSTYLNLQFLDDQGTPLFNFQIGGAYSADDQIGETASNIMIGSPIGSVQQIFNPTCGCVVSNYLNTPGSANKFVAIIEAGKLADHLSEWFTSIKLPFLGWFLFPFKSLQFAVSYCPNSQSSGSLPLSTKVNYMMYMTNWARPNLMGIELSPDQIKEAIYDPNQDISYAGFTRDSLSLAGHWNHDLSPDINLTLSAGMVCAKVEIGCPNGDTMIIDETKDGGLLQAVRRRFNGEDMVKLGGLQSMIMKDESSNDVEIPSIMEHNVLGYKGCAKIDIKNVAEIAFSYLDNGKSLLNKNLNGNSGKSLEFCIVLDCVDFKIGGLTTYSWRNLSSDKFNKDKITYSANFQALTGSVGLQFKFRGFDVSVSVIYARTWSIGAAGDDNPLLSWPQSVYPSVQKPTSGLGFNLTVQFSG